jgi:tape measure domain-containing protein
LGEDGRIIYKVVIDDNNVESEAASAGSKASEALEKSAKSGGGTFEQLMIGAARKVGAAFVEMAAKAVQGVEQIAQAGIDFNAKMETYQTAFTTLLGTAEEAEAVMSQIRKDAASTPFDVDSLTQANQMLISAGVSAGDAREQVLNLANAISATGGGSAELSRMAANLQQIRNVGKATAMDIRQFANAGINIYGLLAESMGVTTEQAAEMEITYDQLAEAFEKAAAEGGVYAGALEKQSQTFTGQISTLKDNLTQLSGVLTQDIFNALSESALPRVMEWVQTLLEAAQTNGINGVLEVASNIFHEMVDVFNEHLPDIADLGFTIVETLIKAISEIIKELPQTVVNIVKALAGAFIEHLPDLLLTGAQLMEAMFEGISNAIPELIGMIPELCQQIIDTFAETDWASIGIMIVDGIWSGILAPWNALREGVRNLATGLANGVKNVLGIASPSKEFQYIAKMCVEGAELGFENNETELLRTVKTTFEGVPDAAALSTGALNTDLGNSIATNISHNMTSNVTGGNTYNITLDAHNVEDFTRIVDLFDSLGVRARMA